MKANFAMAIHFHQPVGNFDHVIENACNRCYVPFLKTLKKYSEIRMSLHFTGCLLEWMEKNRPEIIDMIKKMVAGRQVEIIAGGFYEPIMSSIPKRDRIRQIELLREYVHKKFKHRANGAWIAERVWEPDLPSTLYDSGIKYIILDDTHFLYAGVTKEKTYGYYTTEDNGKSVFVFPSDKTLRYMIPFKMPEECFAYMRGITEKMENPLFVYGDDGEKFGEWPGTHKWVFEEKWLDNFFKMLEKNKDWLETITLSECLEKYSSKGRVYLPTTSYEEMLEWALPVDMQIQMENALNDIRYLGKEDFYKPFIRGGFWRNFLSKYPETNNMHKKMIYVSNLLAKARVEGKIKKKKLAIVEKDLFRGQCNCAYWHGIFGGLYLYHLRRAIYGHLIRCETAIEKALYNDSSFCDYEVIDMDSDGYDEVVIKNKELTLITDPGEGGVIKELDCKRYSHNMINTLARRKEVYHSKIIEKIKNNEKDDSKEIKTIHEGSQKIDDGITKNFIYDRNEKYCFIDHFMDKDISLDEVMGLAYIEKGDFVFNKYKNTVKKGKHCIEAEMAKTGLVDGRKVLLTKKIVLNKDGNGFDVLYSILNNDNTLLDLVFSPELNLIMPDADSDKYAVLFDKGREKYLLKDNIEVNDSEGVLISDSEGKFSFGITMSEECRCLMFPVKTVSQSEKAFELNYQGTSIFPLFNMRLNPGEVKDLKICLEPDFNLF